MGAAQVGTDKDPDDGELMLACGLSKRKRVIEGESTSKTVRKACKEQKKTSEATVDRMINAAAEKTTLSKGMFASTLAQNDEATSILMSTTTAAVGTTHTFEEMLEIRE